MSELPLFPLGSVLFPGGRLPLQIFEQRYLDLVRDCLKHDRGFGMAWIVRGQEVAQPGLGLPNIGERGTYARIVDWDVLPNGLLGITIQGEHLFQIEDCTAEQSQLIVGEVDMMPINPPEPVRPEWDSMLDVLSSLELHPHVMGLGLDIDRSDAWQVGRILAQLLPMDEALKYELLLMDDIGQFMERLDQLLNMLGGIDD